MSEVKYEDLIMDISSRFIKVDIPMSVHLEITKQCNLDCVHCYVDHRSNDKQLTTDEIFKLLDEIAGLGVLQLSISGGEPMVHQDFWKILEYAREKAFFTRVFTSGTLISEEDAKRFKELAIGQVHVSLYSSEAETHELITSRAGSFSKTISAIKNLKKQGVTVFVKSVVLKQNAADMLSLGELCQKLDCPLRIDTNITPAENDVRDPLAMRLSESELADFISDPKHMQLIIADGDINQACSALQNSQTTGQVCDIGLSTAVIDAYGQVQPCSLYPPVASIRNRSFKEIWQQDETIKSLRAITYENRTVCNSCELVSYCTPCAALSKMEFNDDKACSTGSRMHAKAFKAMVKKNSSKV